MSQGDDPFTILGVRREASPEEVKQAYRRLAMHWHPDRNPSSTAAAQFRRVHAAYELFLDPQRMAEWQRVQASAAEVTPDPANENADWMQELTLTLEEAAFGCRKSVELVSSVRCKACQGGGKQKHNHLVPCASCSGCGRLTGAGGRTSRCPACAGRGYVRETDCSACTGSGWRQERRTLAVTVPAGMVDGERLRLARQAPLTGGQGAAEKSGDLFLAIRLAMHPLFVRHGRDLHCDVPVSVFRLLAGGAVEVPTLAGTCTFDLSAGTGRLSERRLPGRGFPGKKGQPAGDLVVRLQCIVPAMVVVEDAPLLEVLEARLHRDLGERAPVLAAWEAQLAARRALVTS